MAVTYFITENYLKENTPVSQNCTVKDIIINVKPVADMFTRSILGTYFYNDLLTKYNAQTMDSNELLLLEYIQPTIAWKAASESVITLSYQLKNKGVQTQNGDFSSNAEFKEVMFLVHHYSDKAEFYMNRLYDYIIKNKELYTIFLNDLNNDSTAKDRCNSGNNNNFNQNIIFI
jgi:hypothetical protein